MYAPKIGTLIKTIRKERGIPAEELAFDAGCDVTTLSRIENNKTIPNARIYEAIMTRLGLNPRDEYNVWSMAGDYETYRKIKDLNSLLCQREFDPIEAGAIVSELENEEAFKKGLSRQFILGCRLSVMDRDKDADADLMISIVNEAIRITKPDFDEDIIEKYYLSYDELILINQLGIFYSKKYGEPYERAIKVFSKLKEGMDRLFVDEGEKSRMYLVIVHNLTKFLGLTGKHEKVIEYCREARELCIKNNNLRPLPGVLNNYAYALFYIGNKDESKKYAKQAYDLYIIMENVFGKLKLQRKAPKSAVPRRG